MKTVGAGAVLALALLGNWTGTAAAAIPSGNLVVNPGAEAAPPGATNRTDSPCPANWSCDVPANATRPTYVQYGTPEFVSTSESARIGGGTNFFAGGPSDRSDVTTATMAQKLNVDAFKNELEAGQVRVTASACLGGLANQDDSVAFIVRGEGGPLGQETTTLTLGPGARADRGSAPGFASYSGTAVMAAGTHTLRLSLNFTRTNGAYGDGYADNLSVRVTPASEPAPAAPSCADTDADGSGDAVDNCPGAGNGDQADNDGDASGDACDTDDDNDGIPDGADAFPLNAAESVDTDGDGSGNNADGDDDNDGFPDGADAFPLNAAESVDTDGDGSGNNGDPDDDNDGVPDAGDAFPLDAARYSPVGTNGNDVLNGTLLADVICGLLGKDAIFGQAGNDVLWGDACDDRNKALAEAQSATEGNDVLDGGDGHDALYGAGGNDRLKGGAGKDKLFGGAGKDTLSGQAGRDSLDGGAGDDRVNGGADVNKYKGGSGNDVLNARNGKKETVDCGTGKRDRATVDRNDKVRGCEKVKRPA